MTQSNPTLTSAPEISLGGEDQPRPSTFYQAAAPKYRRAMALWLYAMCALVALMVTVGGATRLTDSGLSITQWDLVIGTLPPVSEEKWHSEFEKYRQIPEYERVNKGMSLEEFKTIYWWEWGHRNLGRFIGLAWLVPMFAFFGLGAVPGRRLKLALGGVFLLICAQGALGWYMVASGLVDRVDVSQYRLAAHLGLAVILFCLMLWLAFNLSLTGRHEGAGRAALRRGSLIFAGATFVQVILGAFVAGLRAGKTYNTWPMMDGRFLPEGYWNHHGLMSLFETHAAVQFNHRLGAYLLIALAAGLWVWWRKADEGAGKYGLLLLAVISLQALLGIWTVVAAVPVSLGLLHQLGALCVLATALYIAWRSRAA